ncbi:MAG: TonB-dependent receptor [Gammaproteobacteria bacterium]|nr:TonB-dependent receptor [Gammaproteobacteria bacterium]
MSSESSGRDVRGAGYQCRRVPHRQNQGTGSGYRCQRPVCAGYRAAGGRLRAAPCRPGHVPLAPVRRLHFPRFGGARSRWLSRSSKDRIVGRTPEHSFNVFTTYDVTHAILRSAADCSAVDDQISAPQPVLDPPPRRRNVSIDSYMVWDLYTTYRLTPNAEIRVNAFNIFDEEYISQMAEGGAQGIPGLAGS